MKLTRAEKTARDRQAYDERKVRKAREVDDRVLARQAEVRAVEAKRLRAQEELLAWKEQHDAEMKEYARRVQERWDAAEKAPPVERPVRVVDGAPRSRNMHIALLLALAAAGGGS